MQFFHTITILEQLILAYEHISEHDVYNARYALMHTDNAIELALHQIATNKNINRRPPIDKPKEYTKKLNKALGRSFEAKLDFAKLENHIDEKTFRTIKIMHDYRNELYHTGIQHENIIFDITQFYFDVACRFFLNYRPEYGRVVSEENLPERTKRYLSESNHTDSEEKYKDVLNKIKQESNYNNEKTISILCQHVNDTIDIYDDCINVIASLKRDKTRNQVVIESQAWRYAVSDKGRAEIEKINFAGTMMDWMNHVKKKHSSKFQPDPIPSWKKWADKLRLKSDPHIVFSDYDSFMKRTSKLREILDDDCMSAELEIDRQIEEIRITRTIERERGN